MFPVTLKVPVKCPTPLGTLPVLKLVAHGHAEAIGDQVRETQIDDDGPLKSATDGASDNG